MRLASLDDVLKQVGGWRAILAGDDLIEQRDVLNALGARVFPERIGFGRFQVAIAWSELGEHLRQFTSTVSQGRVA